MGWTVRFRKTADKHFAKLDSVTQRAIMEYLERLETAEDPTLFGKPLMGSLQGMWRYRVGKYRLICELKRQVLVVEVITIGKRDSVYQSH